MLLLPFVFQHCSTLSKQMLEIATQEPPESLRSQTISRACSCTETNAAATRQMGKVRNIVT